MGVTNACVDALEQAILERCFFVQVGDGFEETLPVRRMAFEGVEELRKFRNCVVSHVSDVATVASLRKVVGAYRGAKRTRYEQAYQSLMRDKLSVLDRVLQMFTKFEKALTSKASRVINPASARYCLKLGKYLKFNEEAYFEAINEAWGGKTSNTVIKGLDVFEAADVIVQKWSRFANPCAVGLDAKKFDAHVSVEALKYEHLYYTMVFSSPLLRTMLKWQLNSTAVGYVKDGKVEAKFPGRRCSGDLNTSLGNCILMCSMVYAYCKSKNIDAELCNNGDDCVVIMERKDLQKFQVGLDEWFRMRGFRMEVEDPVYELEKIVFCQSQPVFDGLRWRMVRNPLMCMIKDPMCLKAFNSPKAINKWRGAVGRCGMSLTSGIPVMQSFYSCMARDTRKCSKRYFQNVLCQNNSILERGGKLESTVSEISGVARASFAVAFGILPCAQIAFESYYDKLILHDTIGEDCTVSTPLVEQASLVFSQF